MNKISEKRKRLIEQLVNKNGLGYQENFASKIWRK